MSGALNAYKSALRATKIAFRSDLAVLSAARAKVREGFEEKKALTNPEEIESEIKKLEEVSTFLVRNVVQGEKQDDGKYFLNFHDKTELGDNETIKQGKKADLGSLAGAKVRKCSDVKK